MRACIQRVSRANVKVNDQTIGEIGPGLVVLLGAGKDDDESDVTFMVQKILQLRIFADEEDKMNRTLVDCRGAMLVVSQFTLYGDTRKGRRPSFVKAADPETANRLYLSFVRQARDQGVRVATGQFQAQMMVELINDGPVTLLVDSKKLF